MSRRSRITRAVLVIAGFAAVTGSFGVNAASADAIDDIGPLLTSSCSFDQVDAALRVAAPDSADRLDAEVVPKALLQSMLAQPVRERTDLFAQFTAERDRAGSAARATLATIPLRAQVGPILQQVANTCHRY
jgi:hemophore-related protein